MVLLARSIDPPWFAEISATTKGLCFTTKTLKECLDKGPIDWIETGVYIKTANKLYEQFGSSFTGKVYFHRAGPGSGPGFIRCGAISS